MAFDRDRATRVRELSCQLLQGVVGHQGELGVCRVDWRAMTADFSGAATWHQQIEAAIELGRQMERREARRLRRHRERRVVPVAGIPGNAAKDPAFMNLMVGMGVKVPILPCKTPIPQTGNF